MPLYRQRVFGAVKGGMLKLGWLLACEEACEPAGF